MNSECDSKSCEMSIECDMSRVPRSRGSSEWIMSAIEILHVVCYFVKMKLIMEG